MRESKTEHNESSVLDPDNLLPSGRCSRAAGPCCRRGTRVEALVGQRGGVQRQLATWVLFNTVHLSLLPSFALATILAVALAAIPARMAPMLAQIRALTG